MQPNIFRAAAHGRQAIRDLYNTRLTPPWWRVRGECVCVFFSLVGVRCSPLSSHSAPSSHLVPHVHLVQTYAKPSQHFARSFTRASTHTQKKEKNSCARRVISFLGFLERVCVSACVCMNGCCERRMLYTVFPANVH